MCLSSGCGAPSNTRRYICEPMRASAMHALRSAAIYDFYNEQRPHASLDSMTPDQAYFTQLPFRSAA